VIDQFLTHSSHIHNIIKGFNLTKSLFVSSILIGEPHTGKKTLIRYLFPNTPMVSGDDYTKVQEFFKNNNEIIIINFEKLTNFENLDFNNKRVVALANYVGNKSTIDDLFAFIYTMPPLKERPEDIKLLCDHFSKEVTKNLMLDRNMTIDLSRVDITNNVKSLKKSIYNQAFIQNCNRNDIEAILYGYLYSKLEGNNDYKEYLPLFERPLIQAGLAKFHSQLKLSDILGINRNTLRKKIYELDLD